MDRPEFKNSTDFQNAFDALALTFDLHRRFAMDPLVLQVCESFPLQHSDHFNLI